MSSKFNRKLKSNLLEIARIRRVHIIGCSRSGTTMLHYAMSAFKDTYIYEKETTLWNFPDKNELASLFFKNLFSKNPLYLITKRNPSWYKEKNIDDLINLIREHNIYLIYIVRDPRDVLTSKHKLHKDSYYVDMDRWKNSVNGGERVIDELSDYKRMLVVRYEDLVVNPGVIERSIMSMTGLVKRENVESISKLKDNIENSESIDGEMIPYMHKLRNFDISSIGRWQLDVQKKEYFDELLANDDYHSQLISFMKKYDYLEK